MGDMTRLLLLLWAGVTVSTAVDPQKRIINGRPCGANERHYHVKFIDQGDDLICGGSLISNQWILTAAHCWTLGMRAVVGVHGPGPRREDLITAAPEIYADNNRRFHDIMLLKLPTPTNIQPIPLPRAQGCRNRPNVGDIVQNAGHAATQLLRNNVRGNDRPPQLQCGNIPLVDCQNLRNHLQNNYPMFYQNHGYQHWLCGQSGANQQPRVDIAGGDSGGGVVFNGMIYGVNSFMGDGRTAFVQPSVFLDVCEYMNWIEGILRRP